jgi:tetratricopeptide (TPR) repeat protein
VRPGGIRPGASIRLSAHSVTPHVALCAVRSVILCTVLCAALFSSCAKKDTTVRFNESLSGIDRDIASGNSRKALKSLARLRKDAMSAGNWLSIAKRERSLGDLKAAGNTLSRGLSRIPSSAELSAVMADTLILAGRVDDARDYASSLAETPYAPIRAWIDITVATRTDPFAADGESWQAAAAATGLPFFARNGAVTSAMRGDIPRALETAMAAANSAISGTFDSGEMPDDALFRATLCYDAGFPARVLELLPPDDPGITDIARLSLMADAAWSLGTVPVARSLWERVGRDSPSGSALARYDLAVTAPDFADEKATLESLLSDFPAYYPAVVRYVRNAPRTPDAPVFDAIETELASSGFRSQEMERKLRDRRVTRESARNTLDSALAYTQNAVDVRLLIEDIRLDWQTLGDSAKSASRVWNLLERYPDDAALRTWAMWFFSSTGDVRSAIALTRGSSEGPAAFYAGLERALAGDLDAAEGLFARCADDGTNDWRALANIARIKERRDDYPGAIDSYSLAAGLADDDREASELHYEAARLLAQQRSVERARSILGYALELDPSNYRADALLRSLEAAQ